MFPLDPVGGGLSPQVNCTDNWQSTYLPPQQVNYGYQMPNQVSLACFILDLYIYRHPQFIIVSAKVAVSSCIVLVFFAFVCFFLPIGEIISW